MSAVVQLVQHLRPGGLEQLALTLTRFSSYSHQLISLEGNAAEALQQWPRLGELNSPPVFLDKPPGISPATVWRLAGLLRRLRPQALHTHHIGPLLYGSLAARLARVPVQVHSEHDAWHLHEPGARRLQGWLLRLARPLHVAVGDHVARELRGIWPQRQLSTIANGIDTEHFSPQDQHRCREKLGLGAAAATWIGCVARLERVKGVDLLLRAHAEAPRHWQLLIAGSGSQQAALQALAAELGSADRVRFLGQLDDPRLLYGAVDVYCQPSRDEGLPLAPLEAQACGCPTVLTEVGAAAQISGWPGTWRVPAEDPAALLAALRQALDSGSNPRAHIMESFSIRQTAALYDQTYAGHAPA